MIDKEFVEELYTLCKKYKKNINVKIEEHGADSDTISAYDVDICGAWEINRRTAAVLVHAIPKEDFLYCIKGDKE